MEKITPVRVRIAPSPTGYLHLGTARVALFNWLFAKKEGGVFVMRIEDTDKTRSLPMYEADILDGLYRLGLSWDEGPDIGGQYGPYRQSERQNIYEKYIQQLINKKQAFWCFCTKEELEEERKAMLSSGIAPKYGGTCRNLSKEEQNKKRQEGREPVLRLSVPTGIEVSFQDIVRGNISVSSDTIGDFIIAKGEKSPLYNLAVVIDDYEMKISHVIRGEDHISNTPRQILIQKALGFETPLYAHLPLVLSPDRSKLSKRNLETSVNDYYKKGYLPGAIVNFLALIGWNPGDEQEIMSLNEMIKKFSLKKVQKGGGVFNMDKLDWFNARYIKALSDKELAERLTQFVTKEWSNNPIFEKVVGVEKERMKTLADFVENAAFFFRVESYEAKMLVWKSSDPITMKQNLLSVKDIISKKSDTHFTESMLEKTIMPLADEKGRGEVLWPLRVALSGRKTSPGPFEIMAVLGKKETLTRIDDAVNKLNTLLSVV